MESKLFNVVFKSIFAFCIVIFLAIICFWIFIGVSVYSAADTIGATGLKSVVDTVWYGTAIPNSK
jgi:uncharacterized membrane protein